MTSHSIVFGTMIFVVGVKTMALVEGIRDKKVKRNVRELGRVGAGGSFFFGFSSLLEYCGRLSIEQSPSWAVLRFGSSTILPAIHCVRLGER